MNLFSNDVGLDDAATSLALAWLYCKSAKSSSSNSSLNYSSNSEPGTPHV